MRLVLKLLVRIIREVEPAEGEWKQRVIEKDSILVYNLSSQENT